MPLTGLALLFWAVGLGGHLLLLGVLFVRKRARLLPAFTALMLFNVLRTFILFALRFNEAFYIDAYLVAALLDSCLEFAVAFEVAWNTFRPVGRWAPDARRGMVLLAVGSLAMAAAMTWLAAPTASGWEEVAVVKTGFFTSTVLSELFLGMVVLSVTAGLPWKTYVARIAHGLGIYAILGVAIAAAHTKYGPGHRIDIGIALSYTRMVFYVACLVYWIVTLWQQAPEPRELPQEMREHLQSLQARLAYDLYAIRKWRKP